MTVKFLKTCKNYDKILQGIHHFLISLIWKNFKIKKKSKDLASENSKLHKEIPFANDERNTRLGWECAIRIYLNI
jgi:hypothetical protein